MFTSIETWMVAAAYTPWAFAVLATLITIDALIPIVPSESIVIGLASLYVHDRPWLLAVLWAWSLAWCWVGDNLAYTVGHTRWFSSNRFTRGARLHTALEWAHDELDRRGSTIIIVGRFIPGARIAINLACGVVGLARRIFGLATVVSATLWASYATLIGGVAGAWFERHRMLGIAAAIAAGMVLGPLMDWVVRATILRAPRKS